MHVFPRSFSAFWVLFLAGALLAGQAGLSFAADANAVTVVAQASESDDEEDVNDPIEPLNRAIFTFNQHLEVALIKPASIFYQAFVPPGMRTAIGNFLDNLKTPVVLANDILQGEPTRAMQTTQRFLINSTVGLAGFLDVAEDMGIPAHDEDFGQTMGVWGVGEMFYLVLPIFGPSNPRDAVGKLFVDGFFDPLSLWASNTGRDEINNTRMLLGGVDEYSGLMDELDQIKKTSIDYYAALRSMYRQKREAEIKNGEDVDLPPIPDLSFEFDEQDFKGLPGSGNEEISRN